MAVGNNVDSKRWDVRESILNDFRMMVGVNIIQKTLGACTLKCRMPKIPLISIMYLQRYVIYK